MVSEGPLQFNVPGWYCGRLTAPQQIRFTGTGRTAGLFIGLLTFLGWYSSPVRTGTAE